MCRAVFALYTRPHTRGLVQKSRLPQRLAACCAKMNLNRLWCELEELYKERTSTSPLILPEEEQQNRDNEERERRRTMSAS